MIDYVEEDIDRVKELLREIRNFTASEPDDPAQYPIIRQAVLDKTTEAERILATQAF